jgi:hypothetical protein
LGLGESWEGPRNKRWVRGNLLGKIKKIAYPYPTPPLHLFTHLFYKKFYIKHFHSPNDAILLSNNSSSSRATGESHNRFLRNIMPGIWWNIEMKTDKTQSWKIIWLINKNRNTWFFLLGWAGDRERVFGFEFFGNNGFFEMYSVASLDNYIN